MTQPVQEPSQGRIDNGQNWRTSQLFRRPSLGAGLGTSKFSNGSTGIVTIPGDNTIVDVEFTFSPNQIGLTAGGAPPQRDWTYPLGTPTDIAYIHYLFINLSSYTGGETFPAFWNVIGFGSLTGFVWQFPCNPDATRNPAIYIPTAMFSGSSFGFQIQQNTGVDHSMNKGHVQTYELAFVSL